jgi:hypothetical protein
LHAADEDTNEEAEDGRVFWGDTGGGIYGDSRPLWRCLVGNESGKGSPVKGGGWDRVRQGGVWGELKEDKRGENHEEALAQRSCNLAIIEAANAGVTGLCEIDASFLPGLAHGWKK